jgi:tetratricopeptide (TPR) repeat protein
MEEAPKLVSLCFLFIAYFFSLLSKEVSVVLLAVVPLYLLTEDGERKFQRTVLVTFPLFASTLLWLLLRGGKKAVLDPGVSKVITTAVVTTQHANNSVLKNLLAAYGFYLRKLVYPFPLNFAIFSIDNSLALLILILAVPFAAVLFYRYRLSRLPLLLIFIGIVPPVAAYLAEMPWTPYAERYLYLPMVGFSLLLALIAHEIPRTPRILPIALALLFAIPTFYRVSLWADPVAFWTDVVAKSPEFHRSYVGLATAQIEAHDYDGAGKNLERALAMGYDQVPLWNNLAAVYYAKKDYARYETAMLKLASKFPYPTDVYVKLIASFMMIPEREMARRTVYEKVIGYHMKILEKNPSFILSYYNIGKLYWVMGERWKSAHYLGLFLSKAKNDPMRPYAQKILDKVSETTGPSS